ncbi:MAG TPA: matrixin family metalloprotease [Gemmataceae bacterium]|nr:matrixin family metalloprotease [Gemmataceae bacterium]
MARSRRLMLELLEDRTVPAVFGVPWSNPSHLALSFAPDGTRIGGQTSSLFATLDAQEPTAAWQAIVLRALQTWADNTNLNIGVVPDGGQPFGTPSQGQDSPRFGNIRIGAVPLSPDVLAVSVPHDPYLSGGWSGDVILNSTTDFTQPQSDLYGVLLHEFGHVFGLGASTDPASVLYQDATWVTTQLAASDVAAIQALYGAPAPNRSHNHTLQSAAPIRYPSDDGIPFTGTTPLLAFGDLAAAGQNDFFALQTLAYTGPLTFRLQTAGISLLAPDLIVYDANGNILGQAQSTNVMGDMVAVHLDAVSPNTTYYVAVQAATSGLFAVGRYGVAVTLDAPLKMTPGQIAGMLRSAHGDSSGGDSSDDAGPGTIPALRTTPGYAANQHYETRGSLSNVATYSFQSPLSPSGAPLVLTFAVSASGHSGALPQVQVLDANQQPLAAQVLVNSTGAYTIQVNGLAPSQTYYVKLTPPTSANGEDAGFSLVADFGQTSALLPVLAAGSLTTTALSPSTALYVALDQVFQFSLSAADAGAPAGSAVELTITDANGNTAFTLTASSGQTVTGLPVLLTPGAYTVHLAILTTGSAPGSLTFDLRGAPITDPIGPVLSNPALAPMYTYPGDPLTYYYPNGTVSASPYLFVPLVL